MSRTIWVPNSGLLLTFKRWLLSQYCLLARTVRKIPRWRLLEVSGVWGFGTARGFGAIAVSHRKTARHLCMLIYSIRLQTAKSHLRLWGYSYVHIDRCTTGLKLIIQLRYHYRCHRKGLRRFGPYPYTIIGRGLEEMVKRLVHEWHEHKSESSGEPSLW